MAAKSISIKARQRRSGGRAGKVGGLISGDLRAAAGRPAAGGPATDSERGAEVSRGRSSVEGRESRLERRPERCARVGTGKQRASKPDVAVRTRGQTDTANAGSSEPNRNGEAAPVSPPSVLSERASGRKESPGQTDRLMEQVAEPANLNAAWKKVRQNGGAPGIDGITVEAFPALLANRIETLRTQLLDGSYRPSPLRRHTIPKPHGGERVLGIPTVQDRLVQQAILQVRLVRLQLPNEMKLDLGMGGLERREFALGFLHAVLAEHRLAGGDGPADRIRIMRLRHGDKTHAAGGTARRARRGADPGFGLGEIVGDAHGRAHSHLAHLCARREEEPWRASCPVSG